MGVSDEERMLIPLYHGTSDLFLASILESGLGAKIPHERLRTLDLLRDVASAEGLDWSGDPELMVQESVVRDMVAQRVSKGGFNFRHGGTYLTPCKVSAVRYALGNPFGSELLSMAVLLLGKLEKTDQAHARCLMRKYAEIGCLLGAAVKPILIEALEVPVGYLRSEQGKDARVVVDQLNDFASMNDEKLFGVCVQQSNFELTSSLPGGHLRCYYVDSSDTEGVFPDYTLRTVEAEK